MNVVKPKPKTKNTIELKIREGTGSFWCISCSPDSDAILHRLQAQADYDLIVGQAAFAAGELCICNVCLRNGIDYINAKLAANAAACDPGHSVYGFAAVLSGELKSSIDVRASAVFAI
jgi:hypothetical protein